MDRLIKTWPAQPDGDLCLCPAHGVAYQADMTTGKVAYDDAYHDKYKGYEGTPVAARLNEGRCAMLERHAQPGASVLDIGAGCGTFVQQARSRGFGACGFDVIPKTIAQLVEWGCFASDPAAFDVVTFWDSIEHIEQPEDLLKQIRWGAVVLVAIPIFTDLSRVRDSKHYRPGEHFYYWTPKGFIDWMLAHGFRLVERSNHETEAGREQIGAYAFRRDVPAACECGGETYADSFDWPGKPRQWFLRCAACEGMSRAVATEEEARALTIDARKAA